MALTFEGSQVNINENDLPPGYTKPVVAPSFKGVKWTKLYSLTMTKASVENADPNTTVDNIVADVNTQLTALIGAELVVTGAVAAYGIIKSIVTNQVLNDGLYNNDAVIYRVQVTALSDAGV